MPPAIDEVRSPYPRRHLQTNRHREKSLGIDKLASERESSTSNALQKGASGSLRPPCAGARRPRAVESSVASTESRCLPGGAKHALTRSSPRPIAFSAPPVAQAGGRRAGAIALASLLNQDRLLASQVETLGLGPLAPNRLIIPPGPGG